MSTEVQRICFYTSFTSSLRDSIRLILISEDNGFWRLNVLSLSSILDLSFLSLRLRVQDIEGRKHPPPPNLLSQAHPQPSVFFNSFTDPHLCHPISGLREWVFPAHLVSAVEWREKRALDPTCGGGQRL